ncbi:hypothetical protein DY000_02022572 [Brassica cretica]|uniref:Uncharacterized protein n=1 Tax=Brassica cretica TaxID=69181 RepID=A0ABQ7ED68_BRACR|nr:hypothetical protein DY000_02022572 [Brassica cretica]
MELRPNPRLDDGTDRTAGAIPRPTRQAKTTATSLFWSVWLVPRVPVTITLPPCSTPMMDFSIGHFSKIRILKLSEDLGHVGTQIVCEGHTTGCPDHPSSVLLLTAMDPSNSDEPGQ